MKRGKWLFPVLSVLFVLGLMIGLDLLTGADADKLMTNYIRKMGFINPDDISSFILLFTVAIFYLIKNRN